MAFLKASGSFLLNLPMAKKKTTTKLTNGVTLVKTNRTTRELGLVVMGVGFFYRVSLHSNFVENIFCKWWSKWEWEGVKMESRESVRAHTWALGIYSVGHWSRRGGSNGAGWCGSTRGAPARPPLWPVAPNVRFQNGAVGASIGFKTLLLKLIFHNTFIIFWIFINIFKNEKW